MVVVGMVAALVVAVVGYRLNWVLVLGMVVDHNWKEDWWMDYMVVVDYKVVGCRQVVAVVDCTTEVVVGCTIVVLAEALA